jgi:hypothetical protein
MSGMRHGYRAQYLAKQMTRQRVLLAVYWLSDADGLYCDATNAEIARVADRGVQKVQAVLGDLLRDGSLGWTGREGVRGRVLVLMDHENAEAAMAREIQPGPVEARSRA